ncbi:hypothetical protein H2248_006991 [Termitomyces sp. 'cryptogamus']|nr:hypothetical protein H2248_006991 [Termitomyces sp. 'cryptogamus']
MRTSLRLVVPPVPVLFFSPRRPRQKETCHVSDKGFVPIYGSSIKGRFRVGGLVVVHDSRMLLLLTTVSAVEGLHIPPCEASLWVVMPIILFGQKLAGLVTLQCAL